MVSSVNFMLVSYIPILHPITLICCSFTLFLACNVALLVPVGECGIYHPFFQAIPLRQSLVFHPQAVNPPMRQCMCWECSAIHSP